LGEIDFENELACVIMDEIHFINDYARGGVWEQTLMTLPHHIQLVMLSATLDAPEKFALWIENRELRVSAKIGDSLPKKEVYLATSNHRIVPLIHYSFITTNQGIFKQIKKEEALTKEIQDIINKPIIMQSSKMPFNEPHYYKMKKMLSLFDSKNVFVKRQHILNELCKYMNLHDMFPAVLFVLSRKQIDIISREITYPLLEDDSKVPYTIRREAEQIIRKLPNFKEYLDLPEYHQMMCLLEKGIAMHHSGIMPILREVVEILFSKGYIKLLLATETFSTGLNMPIKTTIFTSLTKFDGIENRSLYSHEYTQMAGRAGRRGIDEIGHVIHLNNLFKNIDITDYKLIMQNKPQKLVSKFKISYNLLLNLIFVGDDHLIEFVNQSMIHDDIQIHLKVIQQNINEEEKKMEKINEILVNLKTPREEVDKYIAAHLSIQSAVNKKKKELEKTLQNLKELYINIEQDKLIVVRCHEIEKELLKWREKYRETSKYLDTNVIALLDLLVKEEFIRRKGKEDVVDQENQADNTIHDEIFSTTLKGFIACNLREVHCLTFAKTIFDNQFNGLTAKQLVGIFSCFTNVNVQEEFKTLNIKSNDAMIEKRVKEIEESYKYYQDFENTQRVETGVDYGSHYDLIEYAQEWCDCSSAEECRILLQKMEKEKGLFLGEFVKAILKINNISGEMEKIAENIGNVELLGTLREIGEKTLKYVITNQSLYV
jgi:superfamily II RNA helicase